MHFLATGTPASFGFSFVHLRVPLVSLVVALNISGRLTVPHPLGGHSLNGLTKSLRVPVGSNGLKLLKSLRKDRPRL